MGCDPSDDVEIDDLSGPNHPLINTNLNVSHHVLFDKNLNSSNHAFSNKKFK